MTQKITFRGQLRIRLFEMMDSGVTKFVSYDLMGSSTTKKQLGQIQGALSDLCSDGEITQVRDAGGHIKKVRPNPEIVPIWINSTVLITQYQFKNLGKPDKKIQREKEKKYKQNAITKKDSAVKVLNVWEEVWPDLYQVPKFKRQNVSFTNECLE